MDSNIKAQAGIVLLVIIFIIAFCIGIVVLWGASYQKGTSRDIVQGYDDGIVWHHAYLKNDHKTAYCFDDERFIALLDKSQREQKEVLITYQKYVGRGFFCSAGDYEKVIITNVEEIN